MNKISILIDYALETHKEAMVSQNGNITISYQQLNENIKKVQVALQKIGVQSNNIVGIFLENSFEYIYFLLAAWRIGATVIPLYYNSGVQRIRTLVETFSIEYLITNKLQLTDAAELNTCSSISIHTDEIYFFRTQSSTYKWKQTKPAAIFLSSGSTGAAKGIMLSDENIIYNVTAISDYLQLSQHDTALIVKTFNHVSSIVGELLVSLYNGCDIVLLRSIIPTPHLLTKTLSTNCISVFFATPTLLKELCALSNTEANIYSCPKLRIIHFYGAPISKKDLVAAFSHFKHVNFIYSYGLTEAAPRVTYIERNALEAKINSVGQPINGAHICIRSETGALLPVSKIGEICVTSPGIMLGYFKNDKLTKKTIVGNELHTGDLGYLDSDGFLYIVGRKDNMINIAGRCVYPEEIESVLLLSPAIRDALVDSIEDPISGAAIIASIVLNEEISYQKVLEHCHAYLEAYKVPRIIRFVQEIEKTENGKIKRRGNKNV